MMDYNKIISGTPVVCGRWSTPGEAASFIGSTHHSSILSGYLLYAYSGDSGIKSLIITTGTDYGTYAVSVFYDGYQMLHMSMSSPGFEKFLENLTEENKKSKVLVDSIKNRFYG